MTIELSLLISGISLAFAVYMGIINMKRNSKSDNQKEAEKTTTIIVKLDNITEKVIEIKTELNSMKSEVKELTETVIKQEQSLKSAWRAIDELKLKVGD